MTFLSNILESKKAEIDNLESVEVLRRRIHELPNRDIRIPIWSDQLDVIAEIKRKSPSKGDLASIENPGELVHIFEKAGASMISVLTDEMFFGARSDDFLKVRQSVSVPILRKDFIVDERQVYESYLMGADVILLIVAAFRDIGVLKKLYHLAQSLELNILLETHSMDELEIAHELDAKIVGVNVRDLTTFEENPELGDEMIRKIDKSAVSVWESSISSLQDAKRAKESGSDAVLIGQALVQHDNPSEFIEQIRGIS